MKFLPSDKDVVPNVEAPSGHDEIKCPSSAKKTSARLRHAKAQLDAMGSGEKTTYLGLQKINDVDRAWAIAADMQSEGAPSMFGASCQMGRLCGHKNSARGLGSSPRSRRFST